MKGMTDAYGLDSARPELKWYRDIIGACGEMAVAKALNLYWLGGINQGKEEPDAGKNTQVRYSSNPSLGMVVRPNDPDHFKYVHVSGSIPCFTVHGWIEGFSAKRKEWLRDVGGRNKPAFFVPNEALNKFKEGGINGEEMQEVQS